jgi:hypothetical protein
LGPESNLVKRKRRKEKKKTNAARSAPLREQNQN